MSSINSISHTIVPKSSRIKVYVIDPAKYQRSSNVQPKSTLPQLPPQTIFPKPCPSKKRKLNGVGVGVNNAEFDEDDPGNQESPALKECVTRTGRISKPYSAEKNDKILPPPPPPKIRRREPPSMFKCKTCTKVYVGYTKLRNHFLKFPDHESNGSIFRTVITKKSVATQATQENELGEDEVEDEDRPIRIPDLCIPAHEEPEVEPSRISPISSSRSTSLPGSEFLTPNPTWIPFSSFHSNSNSTLQSQSVVVVSSPSVSPGISTPVTLPVATKSHDNSLNTSSPAKTVWDCVDEKITSLGINHVSCIKNKTQMIYNFHSYFVNN